MSVTGKIGIRCPQDDAVKVISLVIFYENPACQVESALKVPRFQPATGCSLPAEKSGPFALPPQMPNARNSCFCSHVMAASSRVLSFLFSFVILSYGRFVWTGNENGRSRSFSADRCRQFVPLKATTLVSFASYFHCNRECIRRRFWINPALTSDFRKKKKNVR